MSNLNLKGVWIPIEILTDKKLSDKEKYIYAVNGIILCRKMAKKNVVFLHIFDLLHQW